MNVIIKVNAHKEFGNAREVLRKLNALNFVFNLQAELNTDEDGVAWIEAELDLYVEDETPLNEISEEVTELVEDEGWTWS